MADDALKAEKQRGYALGYAAGKRRAATDDVRVSRTQEERYFWDAVFVAATPSFIESPGWTQGDKTLNSLTDRVQLATDWANAALKKRRSHAP